MSNKNNLSNSLNIIKGYLKKNTKENVKEHKSLNQYSTDYLLSICYLNGYNNRTKGAYQEESQLREEIFSSITNDAIEGKLLKQFVINLSYNEYIGCLGYKYEKSVLFHLSRLSLESKLSQACIEKALIELEKKNYIKVFHSKYVPQLMETILNKNKIIKEIKKLQQE